MEKQFLLIVYDISNDRRRTKLHDALLDFGTPVQYSVFECLLNEKEKARLKKRIARIIRPKIDQLRYYYLCQSCLEKTEITSGVEILKAEHRAIVV